MIVTQALLQTPRLKPSHWFFVAAAAVAVAASSSLWAIHQYSKDRIKRQQRLSVLRRPGGDGCQLQVVSSEEEVITLSNRNGVAGDWTGIWTIDASISPKVTWSSECLHILEQGLHQVQVRDKEKLRLRISLPQSDEIPLDHCRDIRLGVPSMRELEWSSHRFQLGMINPEATFSLIETIRLQCELSMSDLAYLMAQGSETLRNISIKKLIEDGSEDVTFSVLPRAFPTGSTDKRMVALETLDITSVLPFASMLNQFTMPALKTFRFQVEFGDVDFSEFTTVVWRQLDFIDIHCGYEKSKLRSLKKDIYPDATFTIRRMDDQQFI